MHMKLRTQYIKKLRGERLWSQEELASAADLSLRTIQRVENGSPASVETTKALASALGVTTDELIAPDEFTPYKHTQVGWTIIFIAFISASLVISVPVSTTVMLWVVTPIFVAILTLFSTLTIEVAQDQISWRFGVGLVRKSIRLTQVSSAEPANNPWYHGFGIRYNPAHGYWLYNVSGPHTIELTLSSGGKIKLGTDEPVFLHKAILSALQQRY